MKCECLSKSDEYYVASYRYSMAAVPRAGSHSKLYYRSVHDCNGIIHTDLDHWLCDMHALCTITDQWPMQLVNERYLLYLIVSDCIWLSEI